MSQARPAGKIENITVTTGDGRTFDLGSPDSPLFKARLLAYRIKRKFDVPGDPGPTENQGS